MLEHGDRDRRAFILILRDRSLGNLSITFDKADDSDKLTNSTDDSNTIQHIHEGESCDPILMSFHAMLPALVIHQTDS